MGTYIHGQTINRSICSTEIFIAYLRAFWSGGSRGPCERGPGGGGDQVTDEKVGFTFHPVWVVGERCIVSII